MAYCDVHAYNITRLDGTILYEIIWILNFCFFAFDNYTISRDQDFKMSIFEGLGTKLHPKCELFYLFRTQADHLVFSDSKKIWRLLPEIAHEIFLSEPYSDLDLCFMLYRTNNYHLWWIIWKIYQSLNGFVCMKTKKRLLIGRKYFVFYFGYLVPHTMYSSSFGSSTKLNPH